MLLHPFKRLYRLLKNEMAGHYNQLYFNKYKGLPVQEVFEDIYRTNTWNSSKSSSGTGSELSQTNAIIEELPKILSKFKVRSLLDIPCGDWFWMKQVDLRGIQYLGGDIVKDIILRNQQLFSGEHVRFRHMNLLSGQIPKSDLILCRDCMVHFSYSDIAVAFDNFKNSESTYLLTTTFTKKKNKNIVTGAWRPLNLMAPPFNFPHPLLLIKENCTEGGNQNLDKSLGLWELRNLEPAIDRMSFSLA